MGEILYQSDIEKIITGLGHKSILITGGTGKLANAFYSSLKNHSPSTEVILTTKNNLDIENPADFEKYRKFHPDIVLHCAARVNADYCETNFMNAKKNIVGGTKNVVNYALETGAKIFYPQSFLIFDGQINPIDESTVPSPISNYGRLKLEAGETILQQPHSLSVIMGGFFGGGKLDRNFVGKFTRKISTLMAEGKKEIEIGDRTWQPTFINDVVVNSLILLAGEKEGTYNMACHGQATFYEVANFIVDTLRLEKRVKVKKMKPEDSRQLDIAARPPSINMVNARLASESLDYQRDWRVSLNEYLSSSEFRSSFPNT